MQPLIVTAAILRDNNRILITRRPDGKPHAHMWEFPGGKLDKNESPEQCLYREIGEELGIAIEVKSIFEVVYHRYDWGPVLILAYECLSLGGEIRNIEVAEHRWVHPAGLAGFPILPADRPIIEKLMK
ncbi:MAG: (deoxy)nucleoside triphosphate pyrophosphohydrolase [Deltaproteobacteria bacterium]|nr:(deoxy)nucleoside triphosphate pyrophosphohydrolase [Deltaproteobacteria bacterium]